MRVIFSAEYRRLTAAVMSTIGIIAYNNLAVAAALPEVGADLGDVGLLPWTITAELLTAGVAILVAGPLVDSLGARRMFRLSVSGFIITSLLCAAAPTMIALVVARALQGLAAGAVLTVATSSIGLAFPAELRSRVFAANSTVWGVTSVAGPSIAAVMVVMVGWRGVFAFNVPVAAFAAALAWNVLPGPQDTSSARRPDGRGIALVAVISAAALALVGGSVSVALIGLGVTLPALGLYYLHARQAQAPVVRLNHLFEAHYRRVHVVSLLVIGGALGTNSFFPIYLVGGRGTSVTTAVFSVIYVSVGWSLSAITASRLQDRYPGEVVMLGGVSVVVPAFAVLTAATVLDAPIPVLFGCLFLLGCGIGSVTTTGIVVLQQRAPAAEMGRLNAAHMFVRTLGITYGVGLAGLVLFETVEHRTGDVEAVRDLLDDGNDGGQLSSSVADALVDGYGYALIVLGSLLVLALPAAVQLVRTRPQPVTSPS